ncbi:hypothetical protein ANOM_005989 [Aspergillus nomiae NRRL 13137]|uniref:Uncharacterized protein n=1 Tax=Aspergillus nomiae NRRL (strain ATCC 15546 / NRRL 13137 / CBS 260.88 / M93) TaxID=1509407 RepID=A0A0L1J338_ASPN3|nr:uncharacterized protein ANOM_005989 [Aspergillus nomiae NRRL 13137]KNG86221.1 hypothetical protein ANOM_005989 [Aspergillus nomiae NRRL 13137]
MAQNLNVTPDVQIEPLFLQLFNYADKTNILKLEDWLSILTLCLSPLIAHILSGVPTVVRRCPSPPTWLDTLCLYNPTTILWRYLASWNAASRHLGVSSIGNQPYNATISMSTIFYPLAVIGLLRLFAAPWLTENYTYHEHETYESSRILAQHIIHTPSSDGPSYTAVRSSHDAKIVTPSNASLLPTSPMAIRDLSLDVCLPTSRPCLPTQAAVVIVRCCYLGLLCAILAICVCYMIPHQGVTELLTQPPSASVLWLLPIMYIVFIVVSIILFIIYLIRCGRETTTVIPCLRTWWYRAYTLLFIATATALIVLSGVYTRRTSCGQLTVFPAELDQEVCNGTPMQVDKAVGPFGIVTQVPGLTPETWVLPLKGWCSGTLTGEILPVESVS